MYGVWLSLFGVELAAVAPRKTNELMLVSLSPTGRSKRRKLGAPVRQAKGAWVR